MHIKISLGNVTLYSYGLMIGIGILFCVLLSMYRARRKGKNPDTVLDMVLLCVITGFLGAKLLYIVVEFDQFLKDPMSVLGSTGFVVYGGIISGVLSAMAYCKIKKISFLEQFDLLIPGVALAQAFGRIGCFLAGCCYGKETDSFLGVVFPESGLAPAGVKLLPTQLFSSAGDLLIVGILLLYDRKKHPAGKVGALYLLLYGLGRFCIEFLRNDERGSVGALSTSQLISIFVVVISLFLFARLSFGKKAEEEKM